MPKQTKPRTLTLSDSLDTDGISTLDVIEGLQAVCVALDESAAYGKSQINHTHQLAMAAKTLSTVLHGRLPGFAADREAALVARRAAKGVANG